MNTAQVVFFSCQFWGFLPIAAKLFFVGCIFAGIMLTQFYESVEIGYVVALNRWRGKWGSNPIEPR